MTEAFDRLSDISLSPPEAQAAWVAGSALRAVLPNVAVAEIVEAGRETVSPPAPGTPHRMLLRLQLSGTYIAIGLPDGVVFTALHLEDGPVQGPRAILHFDTDLGRITTNPQEMSQVLPTGFVPSEDPALRAAFLSLKGAFTVPVPPPKMTPFTSRYLGQLDPGRYANSTAEIARLPAFSDTPLEVVVDALGAEDVEVIDAALAVFLNAADRLKSEATPLVAENMESFLEAVYRGPDGPPFDGPERIEEFETLLALPAPEQIWGHVRPQSLRITRHGTPAPPHHQRIPEGPIYIVLGCHCDWEEEHGLSLVWRNGDELRLVSDDTGLLEERVAP